MWKRFMRSVQAKIMVLFAALLLIEGSFSIVFFRGAFSRQVEDSSYENLGALLTQTQETLSGAFSMVENTMLYFFSDSMLRETMQEVEHPLSAGGKLTANLELDNILKHSIMSNSAWQNELLDSVWFFVDEHTYSFYSRSRHSLVALNREYREVFKSMEGVPSGHTAIFPPTAETPAFFVAQNYVPSAESSLACRLIFSVDETVLRDKFSSLLSYAGAQVYLLDDQNVIYSAGDAALLGTVLDSEVAKMLAEVGDEPSEVMINGVRYYASADTVSSIGLHFVAGIPRDSLMSGGERLIRYYILIMLIVACVFIAVGILAIYRGTGFLKTISGCLADVRTGNYKTRMPKYKSTELAELSDTFNDMALRVDHLVNEVYEKQLAVNQANIRYLQSQINPHFLFNAFAAIGVKAKLAQEESIYQMITSLSTLLSATFRFDDESLVTVSEELSYINCYLYIQKERFGPRLDYQVTTEDDALLNAMIPRLCVEPLVENAVVYGLERKCGSGHIEVTVKREGAKLILAVMNDGAGFPDGAECVEDLPKERDGRKLVGLRNTHQRIKLLYGDAYGVFLSRSSEGKTVVTVCLPLEIKEGENDVQSSFGG